MRTRGSMPVKRQAIGTPDRHGKGTPHRPWDRLVPVANVVACAVAEACREPGLLAPQRPDRCIFHLRAHSSVAKG